MLDKGLLIKGVSALVILGSAAGVTYTVNNQPKEEEKKEIVALVQTAKDEQDQNKDITLEASITATPSPSPTTTPTEEPEVIATSTPKPTATSTPKPTNTPQPLPTAYLRNANPVGNLQIMENKICKVFGKEECDRALGLKTASQNNGYLESFRRPGDFFGVFGLPCRSTTLHKLLAIDETLEFRAKVEACSVLVLNGDRNINLTYQLVKTYGWGQVVKFISGVIPNP